MSNAIFLRDSYFLLPAEFPTFDAFRDDLARKPMPVTLQLIPLLENNRVRCGAILRGQCMAPVFLSDVPQSAVPVTIHSADEAYPARVERIPMEEYDARLREVVRACCPGCGGYSAVDDTPESLRGHHSEISLDGLCLFRWEGEEPPLELADGLRTLADSILTGGLWTQTLTELRRSLASLTGLSIPRARRSEDLDGAHLLHLRLAEGNILSSFVLSAADTVVNRRTQGAYRLLPTEDPGVIPHDLLLPENRAALQSACFRCACSVAEITWDGQDDWRIAESLERIARQDFLHILHMEENRALLLVMEEPSALQALRYRTPLMQRHGAVCTLYRSSDVLRCTLSYEMPFEIID